MIDYIDIALATISVAGFILLYRQTSKIPFLLMGGSFYIKLLFVTFGLVNDMFFVGPELLLISWLCILMFKSDLKYLVFITMVISFFYVLWNVFTEYHMFGVWAFVFMLVCMVWYLQKKNVVTGHY